MAINKLVNRFSLICRELGLDFTGRQMNIMNDFIEGKTPSVAYTAPRQVGKTSLIAAGIIALAIKEPNQVIGFKNRTYRMDENLINRIAGLLNPSIIKHQDRMNLTLINGTIITRALHTGAMDIIFNDEAAYLDEIYYGRKQTFCATTWSGEGESYRRFVSLNDVTYYGEELVLARETGSYYIDGQLVHDLVFRGTDEDLTVRWTEEEFRETFFPDHSIIGVPETTGVDYTHEVTSGTVIITDGTTTGDEVFVGDDWAGAYYIDD
jgi:hypothetical protein